MLYAFSLFGKQLRLKINLKGHRYGDPAWYVKRFSFQPIMGSTTWKRLVSNSYGTSTYQAPLLDYSPPNSLSSLISSFHCPPYKRPSPTNTKKSLSCHCPHSKLSPSTFGGILNVILVFQPTLYPLPKPNGNQEVVNTLNNSKLIQAQHDSLL